MVKFYVLEDNLRCPSGVSYVMENREGDEADLPADFRGRHFARGGLRGAAAGILLQSTAPEGVADPTVAVLTPGCFNSAYFEHSFLAQKMGVELVPRL